MATDHCLLKLQNFITPRETLLESRAASQKINTYTKKLLFLYSNTLHSDYMVTM